MGDVFQVFTDDTSLPPNSAIDEESTGLGFFEEELEVYKGEGAVP